MIPSKLSILVACFILTSCSSDSGNNKSLPIVDDPDSNQSNFPVILKGDDATALEPSQLVYRLYGYDPYLADVSATLVFERIISLDTLPTTINLDWPVDASSLIRPPVASAESARFYLSLQVDLDMDGQICNGDLAQDYSQTDFFTLQIAPAEGLEYFLKKIDRPNESCEGY